MQILVYDDTGNCVDEFNLHETDTVGALRQQVQDKVGGMPQNLRYHDADMRDTQTLTEAGLKDGAKVYRYAAGGVTSFNYGSSASTTSAGASSAVPSAGLINNIPYEELGPSLRTIGKGGGLLTVDPPLKAS